MSDPATPQTTAEKALAAMRDWPIDFLRYIETEDAGEMVVTAGQAAALRGEIERLRIQVLRLEEMILEKNAKIARVREALNV